MATYGQVIEGLQILASCEKDGLATNWHISAEHDILYAGPNIDELPGEVNQKMEALGCWHKSDADCWAVFT
jgi:hypothetical protein